MGEYLNRFTDRPAEDEKLFQCVDITDVDWDDIGSVTQIKMEAAEQLINNPKYKGISVCHIHDINPYEDESNQTLINGILVEDAKTAEVIQLKYEQGESFRSCMRRNGYLDEPTYIANFMFFTTPKLMKQYNGLREKRPQEQIPEENFHIDFFYIKDGDKIRQSFPLYRKACIAKDVEGKFHFFHYALGGGSICLEGQEFQWDENDVNPTCPTKVAIYTPYLSCADEGADAKTYTKEVGKGRVNFVIIGEKIVCIRKGDVLLPSIGVVVSLDEKVGHKLWQQLSAKADSEGYVTDLMPQFSLTLVPPKEMEVSGWDEIAWAYGGGITMIENSVSIYESNRESLSCFQEEGWLSPLSMQTQESDVHDEDAIHPRTMLGVTEEGHMFVLTFSGRNELSRGVTYREACMLAKKYIGNIRYMMAVDGGASTVLGFVGYQTFMELNCPASTRETETGLVRRISSLLLI